jgi:hypothetical protein
MGNNVIANEVLSPDSVGKTNVKIFKMLTRNNGSTRLVMRNIGFLLMWILKSIVSNGTAYLQTGGIIETSCDADIKYYPADDHVCEIELYSDILDLK